MKESHRLQLRAAHRGCSHFRVYYCNAGCGEGFCHSAATQPFVETTAATGRRAEFTYLVNGVLTGGKQVLVGTAAHVKEELVPIADLNQEAGSNLHTLQLSARRLSSRKRLVCSYIFYVTLQRYQPNEFVHLDTDIQASTLMIRAWNRALT